MKPLASRTHTTSPTPANPGEVTTNVSNTATLKNMTSDYPKSYDSLVAYAFELYDVPSDTETEWAVPKRPYSDAGKLKRKRVQPEPASTPTPTALLVPDTITFATNAPGPCGHNGVGCASACSESVAVEVVDVPAPLKTKKFIKGDKNRAKGDVFLNKKGCYVQWNGFNNGPLCQSCAVVGVAVRAGYKDEHGNPNRLCSDHAKAAGTYEVQHPCRDCPDDAKIQAGYKDEDGNPARLCADHAVAAGAHVDTGYTGGSYEACQCFDRLERVLGITLPHIHYHLGGGHSGKEQKGLLQAHPNMKPDCYVPDPTGVSKGTIYQYHGNEWHGYPPGHPKEHEMLLCGMTGREAYEITQAKDRLYTSAGYRLFRIWGHEFAECQRAKCPRNVREVCREFLG